MKDRIRTRPWYAGLLVGLILSLLVVGVALAAGEVTGYAWGTNVGWINFAPSVSGVDVATVYRDHLEGYAWGENIGWIRLGTFTGGGAHTYANDAANTYGVNNDGMGNLSGYAWGTNVGWINFRPTDDYRVVITSDGTISGYAWSENVGWIKFQGMAQDNTAYSVTVGVTAVTLLDLRAQTLSLVDCLRSLFRR